MKQLITNIYQYFQKRPLLLRGVLLLCVALCIWSIFRIHFEEDISQFLPNNPENERINYAYQHIGAANKIIINVSSTAETPDSDLLIEAVDDLVERIHANDTAQRIENIFYYVDQQKITEVTQFIAKNLPYYLSEEDYARMETLMTSENIQKTLAKNRELLQTPAGGFLKNVLSSDPLHLSANALQQLNALKIDRQYQTIDGYLFNQRGDEAMIAITAKYPVSETQLNALLISDIENAMQATEQEFHGEISTSCIGAAVISITNATQIKRDSIISTGLALILILALLLYFFRDVRALLIILFSIAFGAVFGLAFLSIFSRTVSVIAIGAGSIIVGIAVNYPLHFLAHYQQGYSKAETIQDIVSPLVTGNITTVGAFLSLVFISSDAMKDLGIFAAMLLIGTILFVLFFLPHLFGKGLFSRQDRQRDRLTFRRIASLHPEKSRFFVWSIVVLTIPLLILSKRTTFETNMHTINYMTDEQRQKLEQLLEDTDSKNASLYCVAEGKTIEEALQIYEQTNPLTDALLQDSTVLRKSSIGIFLPSKARQQEQIDRWNRFWEGRRETFLADFTTAARSLGFTENAFQNFTKTITQTFDIQDIDYFQPILSGMAENYLSCEPDRTLIYTILETTAENLEIAENQLNNVNPSLFAFNNRSLVNGMVDALSTDFDYVLYICGFIVFLFLTISFNRLELSLITFLPLVIGWIWILGLMALFGIKFNIVNIILATFIFGQGDDYSIFVTEGLMYEYTYRRKMLASYKNSILLSAFIMFIGIGALIVAKHPAMRSLAEVTIIGMFSVVLMAYLFPPLLFKWLTTRRGIPRRTPITLLNLGKTILSFTVFLIGSILLTIIGFITLTLGGKTKKHQLFYHHCLCQTFRFLAKIIPQLPHEIINETGENFEQPAVITCNHQSHIDLMYTLMLHPKIIVLTNQWVWNSPFYGWILRYANFYPVADGIEQNVEPLRKAVADGYSILVFPEGTRSEDGSILRFHSGAFYLAETLQLDILPIIAHGIGDALPKKEFLLHKGKITLKILPRIAPNDPTYRQNSEIRHTAQKIRGLYQTEYAQLTEKIETPHYFKDLVLHNYIYKGVEVAHEAKKNFQIFEDYEAIVEALPKIGKQLIINCGQGEIALITALSHPQSQIVATENDENRLSIAENCAAIPKNLTYSTLPKDFSDFNHIIMLNPPIEQMELLRRFEGEIFIITQKSDTINCSLSNDWNLHLTIERSNFNLYHTEKHA